MGSCEVTGWTVVETGDGGRNEGSRVIYQRVETTLLVESTEAWLMLGLGQHLHGSEEESTLVTTRTEEETVSTQAHFMSNSKSFTIACRLDQIQCLFQVLLIYSFTLIFSWSFLKYCIFTPLHLSDSLSY